MRCVFLNHLISHLLILLTRLNWYSYVIYQCELYRLVD